MRDRIALGVYVLAFSVATFNHASDIVREGWLPYRFAPLMMNGFWTSLTLLDPLAAGLLLSGWRRSGLSLALAVMIADVGVNSYAKFGLGFDASGVSLALQAAFLGFVLGSIGFLWPDKGKPGALRSGRAS